MKIDVTETGLIRLKEVFNSIILETTEGNKFYICMRDTGLEIGFLDSSINYPKSLKWFAAKDGNIKQMNKDKLCMQNVKNVDYGNNVQTQ